MHRIDGPGSTASNQFTEGDPVSGVPATTVTEDWLNALQEEVANTIEGAGIDLDKTDNSQLLAAIHALIDENYVPSWYTGDVRMTFRDTPDAGWVLADDGTIGATGSGASNRADDDTEDLYTLLWENVSDSFAPVVGGRGVSAADDFAAGKKLTLTRMLGHALGVAGAGYGLTARALGQDVGAEDHTLTEAEMPAHTHPPFQAGRFITAPETGATTANGNGNVTWATAFTTGSAGGGAAHNNMQPTAFLVAQIKL